MAEHANYHGREWLAWFRNIFALADVHAERLTSQEKARLLYEYCLASEQKIAETIRDLYIVAEHYAADNPEDLENPGIINGIPPFFNNLTAEEKAQFCYDQVTGALAIEAAPVTVESLRATKRSNRDDAWSSYAGRFVRRVTIYVSISLGILVALCYWFSPIFTPEERWVAFGCLGALVHLLNHALTTTRMRTFEVSEARKIWPRLLLGGIFGFVLPWLIDNLGSNILAHKPLGGSVAAFFGGYSVRFATGLLERVLLALFPEPKNHA